MSKMGDGDDDDDDGDDDSAGLGAGLAVSQALRAGPVLRVRIVCCA